MALPLWFERDKIKKEFEMDAVEWSVVISMIGILGILIYAAIWFVGVINSDRDSDDQ